MQHKLPCYLATFRENWALTQQELATLLGYKSHRQVSRLEQSACPPKSDAMLATELLFGLPPREMFPGLFDEVEDQAVTRLYGLFKKWEKDSTPDGVRKREFAEAVFARFVASGHSFKSI